MSEDGYQEAQQRISQAHADGADVLNLSDLGLERLPPEIAQLTTLTGLNLDNNRLTSLPSEIGGLQRLERLDADGNRLTTLPSAIGELTALETLYLQKNRLISLPPEIASLTALRTLYLSNNQLTDLPPEIASLSALRTLFLDGNQLTDPPPEIASLTALQSLDLSNNQLTDLPPEIASLNALQTLSLNNNQLTDLPPVIASLTALQELHLNNNQLTDLPPEIPSLSALQSLRLEGNRLASLPAQIGELRSLEVREGEVRNPFAEPGLFIARNPLPVPYPRLIAPGQPAATRNVLAWLRGELDPASLPPVSDEAEPDAPGDLPSQEARPYVEIGPDGQIDFPPPEALDAEGNNLRQLRRLHPSLRDLARELIRSLPKDNIQHPALQRRCDAYLTQIDRPLEEVDFNRLYFEGIRLDRARDRDRDLVRIRELAPLPEEAAEALDSLLDAHGAFIMATAVGQEALPAQADYEATPADRRLQQAEAQAATRAILAEEGISISPRLRDAAEAAAEGIGQGSNPIRSGTADTALLRNLTAAVVASAACGAPALLGFLAAGPAGTIVGGAAALPIYKALENTKIFQAARGYFTARIDRLTEVEARRLLISLARAHAAGERIASALRPLSSRQGFGWLGQWLDRLRKAPADQP